MVLFGRRSVEVRDFLYKTLSQVYYVNGFGLAGEICFVLTVLMELFGFSKLTVLKGFLNHLPLNIRDLMSLPTLLPCDQSIFSGE